MFTKKAFDLEFLKDFGNTVCQDIRPGYGISPDDENALFEIAQDLPCPSFPGTDVANCVQFGING
jgi:hypothetical protein